MRAQPLINTSLQRGVMTALTGANRFSGFPHSQKPLKRFTILHTSSHPAEAGC